MYKELLSVNFNQDLSVVLSNVRKVLKSAEVNSSQLESSPIVLIGGGSGTPVVGRALLLNNMQKFSMVANVADTLRDKNTLQLVGAGLLKHEFNVPDVVDITKQLLHTGLPAEHGELYKLLDSKASEAMRVGYLVVAALYQLLGNLQEAVTIVGEALGNHFQVLPVSGDVTEIYFRANGEWQNLYVFAQNEVGPPQELTLKPPANILPNTARIITKAKYLIFGPGDVHFSVLPHFLVNGFKESVAASSAKLLLVINLTARELDIPGFTLSRLLDLYDRYLPAGRNCTAIVHKGEQMIEQILLDDITGDDYGRFKLVRADIASTTQNKNNQYIHDAQKLGSVLINIIK